jgi:AcrR family transcriptional regulator
MKRPAPALALRAHIVDAALALADEGEWRRVRLHDIARRLDVGLPAIKAEFVDLDAVGDAWLGLADDAMLAAPIDPGLAASERIERAMLAWFAALDGRRRTLRQMLAYKLAPSHIHLQAALIVATSRRVQWLREAARLDAGGAQKQVEEIGLTALFAAALLTWLFDDSADGARTRRFIRRRLRAAERAMARLFKPR